MSGATLSAVSLLCLSAPPVAPSFAEVWYREVFEGNIPAAARDYELIYLGQPSEKLRPEVQQKAAFRAGLCFERLGHPQSAGPAFAAAARIGRALAAEDPSKSAARDLAREAEFRLRNVGTTPPADPSAQPAASRPGTVAGAMEDLLAGAGTDVATEVAVQGVIEALRSTERSRAAAILALESTLKARRRRLQAGLDLLGRLSSRGVALLPAPAPGLLPARAEPVTSLPEGEVLSSLGEAITTEAELPRVEAAIREQLLDRILASLRASGRFSSEGDVRLLGVLALASGASGASGPTGAGSLGDTASRIARLRSAERGLDPVQVSALAERRLVDLEMERKTWLAREIHARLDEEAAAEARGRRDQALAPLEKVRDLLDWAPPSLREDPEIRSLGSRASRLFLLLTRNRQQAEVVQHLWKQIRGETERTVRLSSDLLAVAIEEVRVRGPLAAGGRADAVEVCRAEAQRLLESASAAAARADGDRAAAEQALREGLQILEWVPAAEIGPGSSLRQALDLALGTLKKEAAPAESAAGKNQD